MGMDHSSFLILMNSTFETARLKNSLLSIRGGEPDLAAFFHSPRPYEQSAIKNIIFCLATCQGENQALPHFLKGDPIFHNCTRSVGHGNFPFHQDSDRQCI
jgi:hypothetical protein